jgi:leucine dehydrogenase
MDAVQQLIADWDGEYVITGFDPASESWIFVAIHDTTLGPALGGLRIWTYPTQADALRDAMRLAEGMTHKWAALGLPRGGGKSVVALSRPLAGQARHAVLHRYGRIVASLRGTYACGPDLGTTPEDMRTVNDETEHAHGWDRRHDRPLDPGPYTALGVFLGMKAALRQVYGNDDLHGRSVLIQGVGDVGVPLARRLRDAGATLALSDVDRERARRFAAELGAAVADPDAVPAHPCDVYAPCAVGATVNADTIPLLRCRIVAGSANNQLGEAADADRLHARGILYAPDYVINGGGAAALPYLSAGEPEASVLERVHGIEGRLEAMFTEARSRGESPAATARRMVDRVLADGRGRTGVPAR